MHTHTTPRGSSDQDSLFIATMEEGASEHSDGAVSHIVGSDMVTIRTIFIMVRVLYCEFFNT